MGKSLQKNYKQHIYKYYGISTYEELIQEILQKYQSIADIELSYNDEEDDLIQVSNTSDLLAINDFQKVTLQMKARLDEQKQKEQEKLKQKELIRQRHIKEQQQKKQEAIEKEETQITQLEQEYALQQQQKQQELNSLISEQQKLEQYKPDPLPDFEVALNEAKLFDRIKEKEDQLLFIEDKKGFETQLRTVQKEIHDIFHQIYEDRKNQHSENYKKWNQTKKSLTNTKHQIEQKQQELKKFQESTQIKLYNHGEKLQKLKVELQKLDYDQE